MTGTPEEHRLPLSEDLVAQWRRLEASSPSPSIFRTPDWILARVDALGLADSTTVHIWRNRDGISAVFATTRALERLHHRLPLGFRVITNSASGVGAADHTGWSAGPEGDALVGDWLLRSQETILLRNLDPDCASVTGTAAVPIGLSRCPRLDLTTWEGPHKSFAKKIGYYRRRAEREGMALRVVFPGDVTNEHLHTLSRLHAKRFGDESVMPTASLEIQRRLIERADKDLGPIVIQLERNGEPVAILWGLWFAGVFAFYQIGWLADHRELSPGVILVDEAIQTTKRLGGKTFDFLRGPEDYKYRFGAQDRVDVTLLFPRGAAGAVLRLKERLKNNARGHNENE